MNLSPVPTDKEDWREAAFPYDNFTRVVQRVLNELNIATVEDFLRVDWKQVYARGLGESKREQLHSLQIEISKDPQEWLAQGAQRIQSTNEGEEVFFDLEQWPEELLGTQLPLETLSTKARNVLGQNQIETVSAFLERNWPHVILRQLGAKTRDELCRWRAEMGQTPEDVQRWLNENISQKEATVFVLPVADAVDSLARPLHFLQMWPQLVGEVLESRRYEIIRRRNGLNGSTKYSLEELGQVEGVTRERVRQLEQAAERDLLCFLEGQSTKTLKKRLHPDVQAEVEALMALLEEALFPLGEGELWPLLGERYGVAITDEEKVAFRFLLHLKGYSSQTPQSVGLPSTVGRLWFASEVDRKLACQVFKALGRSLRDQVEPKDLFDVRIEILQTLRAHSDERHNLPDLRRFIELWGQAEEVAPELFQTRFEFLESNISRLERVMREWARQDKVVASAEELCREINHRRAVSGRGTTTTLQVICGACTSSTNMVSIGRFGGWSLQENATETRPLFEIMKECLLRLNRPATPAEVFDYVSQKRSCSQQSLACIMNERADFRRVGQNLYALTSWNMPAAPTRRLGEEWQQQFDNMLLELFAEKDGAPIPHAELVRKMHSHCGGHDNTIRSKLERSPYIELRTIENNRLMAFWLDVPKVESPEETLVRQGKRGQARQLAQDILKDAPDQEMMGVLLIQLIEARTGFIRPLIYNALQNAPQTERLVKGKSLSYRLK